MFYLEDDNRFYIANPDGKGEDIAEMTFKRLGKDKVIVDHTFVNINYRGQGIADRLFELVIEKAQSEGRKIISRCSYVSHQFEKHTHLKDLLADDK